MATDDDVLLDAFVRIGPDPDFLTVIDKMADDAVQRIIQKFGSANIPAPNIAPIQPPQAPPTPPRPPAPPGGVPGDDDNIANPYRIATRQIEDMERALRQMKSVGVEIGAENAKRDLQILQNALKEAQVDLRRANQDNDPFGVESAIQRLPDLESRLERVRLQLVQSRLIKEQFDDAVFSGKSTIQEGRIRAGLAQSEIRGLPSGETRQLIAQQTAAIRLQELEVTRLSQAFDGTEESVRRVVSAQLALQDMQGKLALTQQTAKDAGTSLNNLSNNAYQLGQAFEDFSVGYSLNGFAGGIRGAANNVAFLLNNLSQMSSFKGLSEDLFVRFRKDIPVKEARELGARFANIVPTLAGVGSALAILVLPRMIEWLQSLNDVEVQIEDISKQLQDNFEDIDFDIQFALDNDAFARTVSSASSVKEILEQIRDIDFGVDDKRKQLDAIFNGFVNQKSKFSDFTPQKEIQQQLSELNKGVAEELKKLDESVNGRKDGVVSDSFFSGEGLKNAAENLRAAVGAETNQTALLQIKAFKDEVFAVQRSIDNVVEAGVAGNVNVDQLVLAQRQIETFKAFLSQNVGRLDLNEDEAEFGKKLVASLDVFNGKLKETEELVRQVDNAIGEQLQTAIEGVISKTEELADRQLLIRGRIEGTVDAQAEFLIDVRETSQEYAKLIEQVTAFYAAQQGVTEDDVIPLREQLRSQEIFRSENVVLEDQEKLIEEIRKSEERLASLREKNDQKSKKSQFTNFEEFAKKLQTNVLSADPLDSNTKAINDLSFEIRQMNFRLAQRNATLDNLPSQFTDPEGFKDRQRAIEFARPFDESQALKQLFDPTGLLFAMDQAETRQRISSPEFRQNDIALAVQIGVQNAMMNAVQPVVNEQKNTTEAVKNVKVGATAQ